MTNSHILEKWQRVELKLYHKIYRDFQKKVRDYGLEKMGKDVKRLQNIRENLRTTCDIQKLDDTKQTKTTRLKYLYSLTYSKDGIHYIAR